MNNRKNTATDTPANVASDLEKLRAIVAAAMDSRSHYAANHRDRNLDRGLTAADFSED